MKLGLIMSSLPVSGVRALPLELVAGKHTV
jgi:hypothetical protein